MSAVSRPVGEAEIHGALQIAKEVLHSLPMRLPWIGVEASKLGDSVGNIWSSTGSQIHQSTHSIDVGQSGHLCAFLRCLSTQIRREA